MNAIVLHGVADLRYEQVPVPALEPGKVRVRIGFCGVCGSDIPRCFVKGTYHFPTICGHEFAGTVEACGAGVGSFSRATAWPCFRCCGAKIIRLASRASMPSPTATTISARAATGRSRNM